MTVSIVGAGMAGLLAGAMLRNEAQIYEAAPALPNNHHALLRFRTDEIGRHLNIPFQPVDVLKIVKPFRNKVAENVAYSMKCNGKASLRSINTAEGRVEQRFIAPQDFISQLEALQQRTIVYDYPVDRNIFSQLREEGPIISTIPMGTLMKTLNYEYPATFSYRHGWVVKAEVNVPSDLCATIYYPDPKLPIVRATLTGDALQVEMTEAFDQLTWNVQAIMDEVLYDFGLEGVKYDAELVPQRYAKIAPIPDRERRRFILWATDQYNIYSVGRFAIWKPSLLLDDVFGDIQQVMQMIKNGHNYHGRLPAANQ